MAVLLAVSVCCAPVRASNRERDEQEKAVALIAGKAALEDGLFTDRGEGT